MSVIFIAGIDTDAGKTIITGLLAKYLLLNNKSVITQKIAQTGCSGISEDILKHRQIQKIDLHKFDKDKITCPYVFKLPASPHLSAKLENKTIDTEKITKSTEMLKQNFKNVLIEGVGGLMLPLNNNITLIEYIAQEKLPVIIVSTPKLGSINHTLLSLEIAKKYNLNVIALIYNTFGDYNKIIKEDSKQIFYEYLEKLDYPQNIIEVGDYKEYTNSQIRKLFEKLEHLFE